MIQWNDLIQCWRLAILSSLLFPKLHMYWLLWDKMCCTLSTMEPHAKEMKSQMLILVEPLWSYASTPKLRAVLPSTESSASGLHKRTPHAAACFLTILRCSHAEQTERCLKEQFCPGCCPQGAGTHPWNLKTENKHSQSLEGRGNKLSTRDLVLCRCFCKYKK